MTKTTLDINADVIEMKGEIFVVPNKTGTVKNFFISNMEKRMKDICELNGISFDKENTLIGQFWIVMPDYRCDNFSDHDIMIKNDNGDMYFIKAPNNGYFPLSLFKGKKEGEEINVKVPMRIYDDHFKKVKDTQAILTLKLNQSGYRYKNFGCFEEAIDYIKGGMIDE